MLGTESLSAPCADRKPRPEPGRTRRKTGHSPSRTSPLSGNVSFPVEISKGDKLVERFFSKLTCRRTRFENHSQNELALGKLASAKIWIRFTSGELESSLGHSDTLGQAFRQEPDHDQDERLLSGRWRLEVRSRLLRTRHIPQNKARMVPIAEGCERTRHGSRRWAGRSHLLEWVQRGCF